MKPLTLRGATWDWSRPYVMGVVNVTPDSFSDGGRHLDPEAAVRHAEALIEDGADVLDLGGEATNPRAQPIDADEERRRVVPVIEALARRVRVPLSIDTTKAEVARAAVEAGAEVVNDVSGGRFDPAMLPSLASLGAVYVCGHLRGRNLAEVFASEVGGAKHPRPSEVTAELRTIVDGLAPEMRARTLVDPGIGFGKGADPATNVALCREAGAMAVALGCPVVVGPSRKRYLARLTGSTREADLDAATVGACLAAVAGGAHVLRVHNVRLLVAALIA